ncbi:MAG: SDR family NAD(P)-dependent oxidoreductase [Pigmentiphaga sp.]
MNGSVILITGAFGALGSAVARHLDQAGARLVAIDAAPALPDALAELYQDHRVLAGVDLTSVEHTRAAIAKAAERLSPIDGVVNIAGGFAWETIAEGSIDTWDAMYAANVKTVVNVCQAVLPHVREEGGRIVNVGANAAQRGGLGMGAYAASKAGVLRFTEALSEEVKDRGITVNAVLPGIIDTPANRGAMPDADRSRWVTPQAIAAVIAFLLSDASQPITGAGIPVAGRL